MRNMVFSGRLRIVIFTISLPCKILFLRMLNGASALLCCTEKSVIAALGRVLLPLSSLQQTNKKLIQNSIFI